MPFKAEDIQQETYDFNPHLNKSGVIREPSTAEINKFRADIFKVFTNSGIEGVDVENMDMSEFSSLLEKGSEIEQGTIDVVGAFLQDPSADDIRALPWRVQRAFLGYITGLFIRPEA